VLEATDNTFVAGSVAIATEGNTQGIYFTNIEAVPIDCSST